MWTVAFWQATAERAVRGAAGGVATVLGLNATGPIADEIVVTAGGLAQAALVGAVGAVVLSLIALPFGHAPSPSFVPAAEVHAALAPVQELVEREGIAVAHERLTRLDNDHGGH